MEPAREAGSQGCTKGVTVQHVKSSINLANNSMGPRLRNQDKHSD